MKKRIFKTVFAMIFFAIIGFVANNCGKEGTAEALEQGVSGNLDPNFLSSDTVAKKIIGTWTGTRYGVTTKYENDNTTIFNEDGSCRLSLPLNGVVPEECKNGECCSYFVRGNVAIIFFGDKYYFFDVAYLADTQLVMHSNNDLLDLVRQ